MKTKTPEFYYVNGPCGSGKTYNGMKYIASSDGSTTPQNTIYSVPTVLAGQRVREELRKMTDRKVHFMNKSVAKSVPKAMIKKINSIEREKTSNVIICLHPTVEAIGRFKTKHKWEIIIDDAPLCDEYSGRNISSMPELLTNWITAIDTNIGEAGELSRLVFIDKANKNQPNSLDTLLKTKKLLNARGPDYCDDIVSPILNAIANEKNVFVDAEKWVLFTKKKLKAILPIISMTSPDIYSGFKRAIIMGSNLEETMWHKWLTTQYNIKFPEFTPITSKLTFTEYANCERLTCIYLQEEAMDPNGYLNVDPADLRELDPKNTMGVYRVGVLKCRIYHERLVSNIFDTKPFVYSFGEASDCDNILYCASEDDENNGGYEDCMYDGEYSPPKLTGKDIQVLTYGRDFSQYHNYYFAPWITPTQLNITALNRVGFDDTSIEQAHIHSVLEYGIMRTSMRNRESTEPVTVIVQNKSLAEAVAKMFPGSKIAAAEHPYLNSTAI